MRHRNTRPGRFSPQATQVGTPRAGLLCGRARRGWIGARLVLVLALVGVAAGLYVSRGSWSGPAVGARPLTARPVEGRFVHEILERGDIQSSSNIEVRCEVQSRYTPNGTAILEIVPEGTYVQPGDFLVRLDDSALRNELIRQQIDCNTSKAEMVRAETAVETARLALEEYESGTFKQEEELLQSEALVAEENLRRATEYLHFSERLASKGYLSPVQLEADRFAVEKARKELDVVSTKMQVLRSLTKVKMLKQLESDLRTAEAQLSAAQERHKLDLDKLEYIEKQVAMCVVQAPGAGQVVYANDGNSTGEVLIEEGRLVRERQVLIRLPDPKRMQVVAKINESRIDLVRPGLACRVEIDALPGVELKGVVRRVSEYPLPTSTYSSHIKDYATEIEIVEPIEGLRPGMTAQVSVLVREVESALQVPTQAVFHRDEGHYCLVYREAQGPEARPVVLGPSNDQYVIVEEGLTAADDVILAPREHLARVELPEHPFRGLSGATARLQRRDRQEHVVRKVVLPETSDHITAGGGL